MRVGVPREIKTAERRVALTPGGAAALAEHGHDVTVQTGAGAGAGFGDEDYTAAGAKVADDAAVVWGGSNLLLKVKEPLPSEFGHLRPDLTVFTYLHLAADAPLTLALLASGATAYGYETVQTDDGRLPLLAPMSEIAGRLAAQAAAHHLEHPGGGPGILLGGVPGVRAARVLVVGGGAAGTQCALAAAGLGAEVTVLERDGTRIRQLAEILPPGVRVLFSDPATWQEERRRAEVVVAAVLVPGARAPRLLTRAELVDQKPGALLVDIAVDQGGCFETTRPTTHDDPVFTVDGVAHYCVANMPGAVPWTSTRALTSATLPFVVALADALAGTGPDAAPALAAGRQVAGRRITHPEVAAAFPEAAA